MLLWFQIKWATFIGLGMLMLTSPATGFFVKRLTHLRKQMLVQTDQRVKLMNQLLAGIRVLKLYAWEAAQEAMVRCRAGCMAGTCAYAQAVYMGPSNTKRRQCEPSSASVVVACVTSAEHVA